MFCRLELVLFQRAKPKPPRIQSLNSREGRAPCVTPPQEAEGSYFVQKKLMSKSENLLLISFLTWKHIDHDGSNKISTLVHTTSQNQPVMR